MIRDNGYSPGADCVAIELEDLNSQSWILNERNLRIRINNMHKQCLDINTECALLATLIRYKCEKYGENSVTGEADAQAAMTRLDKTLKSIVFKLKSYSYLPSEAGKVLHTSHTHKGISDVCEALQVFPPDKLTR